MCGGWWPRPQRAAARCIAETAQNRGILRCTGGGMRQSLIFRAVRASCTIPLVNRQPTTRKRQQEVRQRQWTQERAGELHRKTSEPRIQSWLRPAVARAGGGGEKGPTQRETPRTRGRAVSVRTSASGAVARSGGANARIAGGRASASTSTSGADARSAGGRASASTSTGGVSRQREEASEGLKHGSQTNIPNFG